MNYKKAFTLAEVLITIAIIGIVAALTIPVLLAHIDHAHKISYIKKAQSSLNQSIKLSENENEDYSSWDRTLTGEDYVKRYISPFTKIVQYCATKELCGYKSNWSRYNGNISYTAMSGNDRISYITLDGILYLFLLNGGTSTGNDDLDLEYDLSKISPNVVFIDINGAAAPNRFGNDVFALVRTSDGTVMPLGYNLSDEKINFDCTKEGLCLYCAEKIRRNGWKAPRNYPW